MRSSLGLEVTLVDAAILAASPSESCMQQDDQNGSQHAAGEEHEAAGGEGDAAQGCMDGCAREALLWWALRLVQGLSGLQL